MIFEVVDVSVKAFFTAVRRANETQDGQRQKYRCEWDYIWWRYPSWALQILLYFLFFLLLKMKNDKETWEESEGKRMGVEKEKRLCYLYIDDASLRNLGSKEHTSSSLRWAWNNSIAYFNSSVLEVFLFFCNNFYF